MRSSRRRMGSCSRVRSLLLALLLLGGTGGLAAAQATPEASPVIETGGTTIPDTAAGGQLLWLLDLLNGDTAAITPAAVEAHFSEGFLAQVATEQVVELLVELASARPWSVASIVDEEGDHYLQVILRSASVSFLVTISVEADEPHLINGLLFAPPPAVSWEEVDTALAALGPNVSLLAAEVSEQGCRPVFADAADRRLAVGSTFKLYVLGELARQVASGEAAWDEVLPIDERYKSLPSGDMRTLPAGTEHTLRYYAELMIAQSDNTATDHLIARLGRDNVTAMQATMGHGDPAVNTPFLTTRELFILKLALDDATLQIYLAASPEERRAMLDGEIAAIALPGLAEVAAFAQPTHIDTLEWFASGEDLCAAMAYLLAQSRQPGLLPVAEILSLNPGILLDRATWPVVFFKGGSEPGVLNLTYLLIRDDGRVFAVTTTINNPDGHVGMEAAGAVVNSAIGLLAQLP